MSFHIKLKSRDIEFECSDEQTLLQAASAVNILLPHGCRAGQCGRCKARLVSGDYFYPYGPHDAISETEIELGQILICQARPLSDMTIESADLMR